MKRHLAIAIAIASLVVALVASHIIAFEAGTAFGPCYHITVNDPAPPPAPEPSAFLAKGVEIRGGLLQSGGYGQLYVGNGDDTVYLFGSDQTRVCQYCGDEVSTYGHEVRVVVGKKILRTCLAEVAGFLRANVHHDWEDVDPPITWATPDTEY